MDIYDALTTDRPYRKALGLPLALEELERHSGRQFDPELVRLVAKSASIRALLLSERPMRVETPPAPAKGQPIAWAARVTR